MKWYSWIAVILIAVMNTIFFNKKRKMKPDNIEYLDTVEIDGKKHQRFKVTYKGKETIIQLENAEEVLKQIKIKEL